MAYIGRYSQQRPGRSLVAEDRTKNHIFAVGGTGAELKRYVIFIVRAAKLQTEFVLDLLYEVCVLVLVAVCV